jgi:hypothetical protein
VTLVRAGTLARRVFSTEGVRDAAVLTLIAILGGGAAFAAVEKDDDLSARGDRILKGAPVAHLERRDRCQPALAEVGQEPLAPVHLVVRPGSRSDVRPPSA